MNIALATIYHDPPGRLYNQITRVLPGLANIFAAIAVRPGGNTYPPSLTRFSEAGGLIFSPPQEGWDAALPEARIGQARRQAVALANSTGCPFILYSDCDRILHWAEYYPAELEAVCRQIQDYDFTVLGRTARALASHPRTQRDTEAIINRVFELLSGCKWDIAGAARGLSTQAAAAITTGCQDDEISTDMTWPLFIQKTGQFSCGYLATEGLEFETADRFGAEVAAAGSVDAWVAGIDSDPRQWLLRMNLAQVEIKAGLSMI